MAKELFCVYKECGKHISIDEDWICPWCEEKNGKHSYPGFLKSLLLMNGPDFYKPCRKCGRITAMITCPYCNKDIVINPDGAKGKAIKIRDRKKEAEELFNKIFPSNAEGNGEKKDLQVEDVEEAVSEIKDLFSIFTGKKDPHEIQVERLKRQKEKELLKAEINKIKGPQNEEKKSAWEKYAQMLKNEEEKQRFLNELRILKALGKIEQAQKFEEIKRKEIRKLTHKYQEEFDVDHISDLSPENLKKYNEQKEDIEDLFDKMRMEL